MNLICDTNIWYNIAQNKINTETLINKGYKLIANPINVLELITNEGVDINLKESAIDSILKYSENFITKSPDEYLIDIWGTKVDVISIDWKKVLIEYKELISNETDNTKINNIRNFKNNNYNNFSNDVTLVIERFLPGFEEKRKRGRAPIPVRFR